MDEAKTTLPDAETIQARLMALDEAPEIQRGLYPKMVKHAGTVTVGRDVAVIVDVAIFRYTVEMPMPAAMEAIIGVNTNKYIDAICPDQQVAADAKAILAQVKEQTQRQTQAERSRDAKEAEGYQKDRAFVRERSTRERPIGSWSDIRSLWGMRRLVGQAVKYSKDQGQTWEYAVVTGEQIEFQAGDFGCPAARELLPNAPMHVSFALTDEDFEQGMVVREANQNEIEGITFSGAVAQSLLLQKANQVRHGANQLWHRARQQEAGPLDF
jgi:hypothetical protein